MSHFMTKFIFFVLILSYLLISAGCNAESLPKNSSPSPTANVQKVTNDSNTSCKTNISEPIKQFEVKLLTVDTFPIYDISKEVKDWFSKELSNPDWSNKVFLQNGNTYVLIKSSSSGADGVEWDGFKIVDNRIDILYKTLDYHQIRSNLYDYLLMQLMGEFKVNFIRTGSTEE